MRDSQFVAAYKTMFRAVFLGRNKVAEVARREREEALKDLGRLPAAGPLIEWLESLHAEDYMALRMAKGGDAERVKGQASRTDEILKALLGTDEVNPRRKR